MSRKSMHVAGAFVFVGGALAGLSAALGIVRRVRRARTRGAAIAARGDVRVVVVGAGFAGTHVVRRLEHELRGSPRVVLTLVEQNDFTLYTPMLTEAAGGELESRHIVAPLRDLPARVRIERGRVDALDLERKRVTLTVEPTGDRPATRTLDADHLVIALGSVPNFHGIAGLAENSVTMKNLRDAREVRTRVLDALARADATPDLTVRRRLLTVVVGGAGYTGVETIAAVNGSLREGAARADNLRPGDVRAVLIADGERLLPELSAELAAHAESELRTRGVEIRYRTKVTAAGPGFVEVGGSERITTELLIWAGGVVPAPVVTTLHCAHGRHGAIVVDGTCRVPGFPGVWALGDCAEIPQPGAPHPYATTAQNATREGDLVARNLAATLRGEPLKRFTFRPIGELALVGKRAGVGRVYGIKVSGPVAWAMWRAVYLAEMPSVRQRVRIVTDWFLDATVGRTLVELPSRPEAASEGPENGHAPRRHATTLTSLRRAHRAAPRTGR